MKKIQIVFAAALALSMLFFASCGGNNERTSESGTDAAVEANGEINGSDAPYSNAESGAAAGDKINEDGTANDTVQAKGGANVSAPANGAPMSKE